MKTVDQIIYYVLRFLKNNTSNHCQVNTIVAKVYGLPKINATKLLEVFLWSKCAVFYRRCSSKRIRCCALP